MQLPARAEAKIRRDPASGCWVWTGATTPGGYGQIGVNRRPVYAHRFVYEVLVGPIPPGLELDHLCRVRNCVAPEHLEPVTRRENVLRGVGAPAVNAAKTHCPQGHPYDAANTYVARRRSGQIFRQCRMCRQARVPATLEV